MGKLTLQVHVAPMPGSCFLVFSTQTRSCRFITLKKCGAALVNQLYLFSQCIDSALAKFLFQSPSVPSSSSPEPSIALVVGIFLPISSSRPLLVSSAGAPKPRLMYML
jgi:hypothetical protein